MSSAVLLRTQAYCFQTVLPQRRENLSAKAPSVIFSMLFLMRKRWRKPHSWIFFFLSNNWVGLKITLELGKQSKEQGTLCHLMQWPLEESLITLFRWHRWKNPIQKTLALKHPKGSLGRIFFGAQGPCGMVAAGACGGVLYVALLPKCMYRSWEKKTSCLGC